MTSTETLATSLSEGRKKFLHLMFTTALEGGIQYWADVQTYNWSKPGPAGGPFNGRTEDIDDFQASVRPAGGEWGIWDESDDRVLIIDLAVMERGAVAFRRYCHGEIDSKGQPVAIENWKPLSDDHYWRQWLVQEITNGQEGDSDAEVADQIVQWGLFGRGIYG